MSGDPSAVAAALLAGNLGDVLGGIDSASVDIGRLAGRVEVLQWCQKELGLSLERWRASDRFADTRAISEFLLMVQDSLRAVQDGSGTWAGLVVSVVGEPEGVVPEDGEPPSGGMGG